MDGLDRERALRYMVAKLHEVFPTQWTEGELTELVAEMYEADNRYMQQARVLDAEGRAGDSFYDDDDAFEFIVEALAKAHHLTEDTEMRYATLVDGYMEEWEKYLDQEGLITWD